MSIRSDDPAIERTLRDEIYAAPDDDGPRSIYADWLIERGDPYGTFIALQLARAQRREPSPSDEEQALLDAQWRDWFGELAIGMGPRRIEIARGFLSAIDLADVRIVDPVYFEDPLWGTVQRLAVGRSVDAQLPDLLAATRRSLRWLGVSTRDALELVMRSALDLEELAVRFELPPDAATLAALATSLPRLRTLGVSCLGEFAARWIERTDEAGFRDVRLLCRPHVDDLRAMLRAANRTRIVRVAVELPSTTVFHADRDTGGALVIRRIELDPAPAATHDALASVQRWLAGLRRYVDPGVKVTMPRITPELAEYADRLGLKLVRGGSWFGARPTAPDPRART